ncbi:hypothetical protein HDU67_007851 [Dinochytrium kinnereticum]|nr:hypothetical protein HDU67_007851 [Dinochytrium kinnereticum]
MEGKSGGPTPPSPPAPLTVGNGGGKLNGARTVYVTNLGNRDKADLKALCLTLPGFVRVQFGQTNFRVVLKDSDYAKEAMSRILGTQMAFKASFARKEPEEKKIEELGEPSKVLWTSTLYWTETEFLKYLRTTYEGFERLIFDTSHSWVHFRDVQCSTRALEDMNSTTNLYSVYSKKFDRETGNVIPHHQQVQHNTTTNTSTTAQPAQVQNSPQPPKQVQTPPPQTQQQQMQGVKAGMTGNKPGTPSTTSGRPTPPSTPGAPTPPIMPLQAQNIPQLPPPMIIKPSFPSSPVNGKMGQPGISSPPSMPPPGILSPQPHPTQPMRPQQQQPQTQPSPQWAETPASSLTHQDGIFRPHFASQPPGTTAPPFRPPTLANRHHHHLGLRKIASQGSFPASGLSPLSANQFHMGPMGRKEELMAGESGVVRVSGSSGAEHFPIRSGKGEMRKGGQIVSNVILIRNSPIQSDAELRGIFSRISGFASLLLNFPTHPPGIYVRFTSVASAKAVFDSYNLREVLGGGFGSVAFQYRGPGAVPEPWESLVITAVENDDPPGGLFGVLRTEPGAVAEGEGEEEFQRFSPSTYHGHLNRTFSQPSLSRPAGTMGSPLSSPSADPWARAPNSATVAPVRGPTHFSSSVWGEPNPTHDPWSTPPPPSTINDDWSSPSASTTMTVPSVLSPASSAASMSTSAGPFSPLPIGKGISGRPLGAMQQEDIWKVPGTGVGFSGFELGTGREGRSKTQWYEDNDGTDFQSVESMMSNFTSTNRLPTYASEDPKPSLLPKDDNSILSLTSRASAFNPDANTFIPSWTTDEERHGAIGRISSHQRLWSSSSSSSTDLTSSKLPFHSSSPVRGLPRNASAPNLEILRYGSPSLPASSLQPMMPESFREETVEECRERLLGAQDEVERMVEIMRRGRGDLFGEGLGREEEGVDEGKTAPMLEALMARAVRMVKVLVEE